MNPKVFQIVFFILSITFTIYNVHNRFFTNRVNKIITSLLTFLDLRVLSKIRKKSYIAHERPFKGSHIKFECLGGGLITNLLILKKSASLSK